MEVQLDLMHKYKYSIEWLQKVKHRNIDLDQSQDQKIKITCIMLLNYVENRTPNRICLKYFIMIIQFPPSYYFCRI